MCPKWVFSTEINYRGIYIRLYILYEDSRRDNKNTISRKRTRNGLHYGLTYENMGQQVTWLILRHDSLNVTLISFYFWVKFVIESDKHCFFTLSQSVTTSGLKVNYDEKMYQSNLRRNTAYADCIMKLLSGRCLDINKTMRCVYKVVYMFRRSTARYRNWQQVCVHIWPCLLS